MQAFIITAYKDKEQLLRLINLANKIGNVYVHIDKKSVELDATELRNMNIPNTYFISKYKIYWGSYNHVLAILELLKKAIANEDNHYFHMISGQDIPIKSKNEFDQHFNITDEKIYMTLSTDEQYDNGVRERYYYYYPFNNGNPAGVIFRLFNRISVSLQKLLHIRRNNIAGIADIYKGMIWSSMPRSAAQYVTEYIKDNPDYLRTLKHIKLPEEFFFQTLIMNSDFRHNAVNGNLRYTDWEHGSGGSPAILDENSYDIMMSGEYFFARKIDSKVSKALIERLTKYE